MAKRNDKAKAAKGPRQKTLRYLTQVAPKEEWRFVLILSLRSLKSRVSEEICGRFGLFDGSTDCISNYL